MLEPVSYSLRLGTLGFGGPVALCGLMEKDLVQDRGWLTGEEMRDAIAVSQSLPGPLAIRVGIFVSYMRCGSWGAWAGGWAFILPNFLIVAALGALYVPFGGLSWMTAIFYGVSPALAAREARHGRLFPVDRGGCVVRGDGRASGRSGDPFHRRRGPRFKISNPLLIGATAVVGLIAFPVLQPSWVFVQ